jgi:hypothetical protein
MKTKPLREVVRGETFRPAGSPHWRTASENAQSDRQRGVCIVLCQAGSEVRGLGHLVCEIKS